MPRWLKTPGARTPPALSATTLLDIEAWSRRGLNEDVIATLLGLSRTQFDALSKADPRTTKCPEYSRASGIHDVAGALLKSATSARGAGAARFYPGRIGAANWAPPKAATPQITVYRSAVEIDMDGMAGRFDRQRELMDGTAECPSENNAGHENRLGLRVLRVVDRLESTMTLCMAPIYEVPDVDPIMAQVNVQIVKRLDQAKGFLLTLFPRPIFIP